MVASSFLRAQAGWAAGSVGRRGSALVRRRNTSHGRSAPYCSRVATTSPVLLPNGHRSTRVYPTCGGAPCHRRVAIGLDDNLPGCSALDGRGGPEVG